MQERTRYRVTGSLFLIALGVIFLPMIFDGAGADDGAPPIPDAPTDSYTPPEMPRFTDVVPPTDVVEKVTEFRSEVDEDGFATADGTRFGEPTLSAADEDTTVWAVQAASFGRIDNARSFRTALREAGLEAFISSAKGDADDVLHRVAVGPLLSPLDAQEIQAQIATAFEVDPQIVAMEP